MLNSIAVPTMPVPQNLAEWQASREEIRSRFWGMLGDLPPLFTPQPTLLDCTTRDDCIMERFVFDNGTGAQVYGYFLLPLNVTTPVPAVLYMHAHGGEYAGGKEKLFQAHRTGVVVGPALLKAGYAVLAIDCYAFGERTQGPPGSTDTGRELETTLFKHFLWQGVSLWGMIVRDDLLALNYLVTRPEIDPTRIGVTGISLGGSRTTWLGAFDERPSALVAVAQMTRYRDFAASGQYPRHSIYYYVPNALKADLDMEHLVALAAPRIQTILCGDSDVLSPLSGILKVRDYNQRIYELYGASDNFEVTLEEGVDHQYTPDMLARMLATMERALR